MGKLRLIAFALLLHGLLLVPHTQAALIEVDVTITVVDSESRQITVTYETSGGRKEKQLDVSRKATIKIAGQPSDLESLKSGQKVRVSFESELQIVTKITGDALSPTDWLTRRATAMGSRLVRMGEQPRYLHGANLAWLDGCYPNGFGICPEHPDWGCGYNSEHLGAYFADMKKMNVGVVRLFVFESLQGLVFGQDGLVSGLDPTFSRNFDDILRIAERTGLSLYLCLGNDCLKTCQRMSLRDIASNPDARNAYLTNAVVPLVRRCKGKSCVFAIDIVNEPEQEIAGPSGNWTENGVSWEVMRTFLRASAEAIHHADPSRLVSCGSGFHEWENVACGRFSDLGFDFYDIHIYSDDGEVPPVSVFHVDKPVIIGEYGQRLEPIDYAMQEKIVRSLLRNALMRGYSGTFVWAYNHPNEKKPSIHDLLVGQGSGEWRPVCKVLQSFPTIDEGPSKEELRRAKSGTAFVGTYRIEVFDADAGRSLLSETVTFAEDGRIKRQSGKMGWWCVDGGRLHACLEVWSPVGSATITGANGRNRLTGTAFDQKSKKKLRFVLAPVR
jgi:hypothetical protein